LNARAALRSLTVRPGWPDTLNASLTEAIKWADGLQDVSRLVATEYAAGRGPFQERARLVALAFAFLWDYAEFVRRWATWAEQHDGAHPENGLARSGCRSGRFWRGVATTVRSAGNWRGTRGAWRAGRGRRTVPAAG